MYSASGYAFTTSYFSDSAKRPKRAGVSSDESTPACRVDTTLLGPMRWAMPGGDSQLGVVITLAERNASAACWRALGTTRYTAPVCSDVLRSTSTPPSIVATWFMLPNQRDTVSSYSSRSSV